MNFNIAQSSAIHTTAQDWTRRVVKNGGATPSGDTVRALSTFVCGMDNRGLTSKMKAVNCFVPDNLIASITPLIKGSGNDPWTNNGPFIAGDLTIAGLKGNGSTKYLDTNITPPAAFGNDTSAGLTLYNTVADATAGKLDFGAQGSGVSVPEFCLIYSFNNGNTYFSCWDETANGIAAGVTPITTGYMSGNRISATASNIYAASSTYAHASFATLGATAGTRTNMTTPIYVFAESLFSGGVAGAPSLKRFSFAAIHLGLTSIDSQNFYNLIQTMRQQLGGGYV